MNYAKSRACEVHPTKSLTFICTQKNCFQILCVDCVYTHCKDHEKTKTFPEMKSIDTLRQDLSQNVSVFLRTMYQELDDMSLSSSDKILKTLDNAEEEVVEIIRQFFKEKRTAALKEIEESHQGIVIDTATSQVRSRIQEKIMSYENLNAEVNNNDTQIETLEAVAKRDLEGELQELLEEISTQLNPVKLWKSDNMKNVLIKGLDSSFSIGRGGGSQLFFPPDKRDSDIDIIPGQNIVITKKGEKGTPSICLGPCLNQGIHSFTVRIDMLATNNGGGFMGWVGLGFIDNDQVNLAQNNYSMASCICSDQSFYKVHVTQTASVTVGGVYHFEVNFETGEIHITGDNGLACRAEGYKGKSLFPYFELTHKHQLTVMNYKKTK